MDVREWLRKWERKKNQERGINVKQTHEKKEGKAFLKNNNRERERSKSRKKNIRNKHRYERVRKKERDTK